MLKLLKRFFDNPGVKRQREFLAKLELFQGLDAGDLARVQQCLSQRSFRKGEVIFAEGDVGRAIVILESGEIEIHRTMPDGSREKLNSVAAGKYIGEMALLEAAPRSATATAAVDSSVFLLHKNKLEGLMEDHPAMGMSIMRHFAETLSRRFRKLEGKMLLLLAELAALKSSATGAPDAPARGDRIQELERALADMAVELQRLRRGGKAHQPAQEP